MAGSQPSPNRRPFRDIQSPTQTANPGSVRKKQRPKKGLKLPLFTKKINDPKKLKITALAVIIILLGLFVQSYIRTRDELKRKSDPQAAMREEAEKLAKEVGVFLELPQDETPSVATVKDEKQLQDLLFFERAQKDDKVLIYPNAKRAVLYRPSTKKVLEYAPVESTANQ